MVTLRVMNPCMNETDGGVGPYENGMCGRRQPMNSSHCYLRCRQRVKNVEELVKYFPPRSYHDLQTLVTK